MLSGFQNAARVPELKRRLLFTAAMLAVYRLGVHVPTPGIDRHAMAAFFEQQKGTLFGFLNLFSGGALEQFSVFSLGIMPYISASIILQLLTVVFPYLERLSKEGEVGRRKITQYTRYGTVVLSIIQGIMISVGLEGTRGPGCLGQRRHHRQDRWIGKPLLSHTLPPIRRVSLTCCNSSSSVAANAGTGSASCRPSAVTTSRQEKAARRFSDSAQAARTRTSSPSALCN
jgi:hypothetical protein